MRKSIMAAGITALVVGGTGTAIAATASQPDHYTLCATKYGNLSLSFNGHCKPGERKLEVLAYLGGGSTPTHTPIPEFTPKPVRANAHTAITTVKNRLDSGVNGNWAKDDFNRQVTVRAKSTAPLDKCGAGATTCYQYTGSLKDFGTFTTIKNAVSPNDANKHIAGAYKGVMKGGTGNITFYASSLAADQRRVPRTVYGNNIATGDWVKQFFPTGTKVANVDLGDWSWTYQLTCGGETWKNAKSGNSGNITGERASHVSCGGRR